MKRILVWLSWGVDSAVTAYLLQKEGYDVTAWFMINYTTDDDTCTTKEDLRVAQSVADYLGIKLYTFDFQKEYHDRIVQYIVSSYEKWLTPNPDVMCNSDVKFRLFLEEALALGFDAIATGHYAQIESSTDIDNTTQYVLKKGIDPNKDQSYFLSWLNQFQLSKAIFPLGWLTKPEVRAIAQEAKLPNADRKDSQGICFIGKVPMREFLHQYIPIKKWNILNIDWDIIGQHDGARWYTIWQRRGIWFAGGEPLFVIKKDITTNTIVLGTEKEAQLYSNDVTVSQRHWVWKEYTLPFHGHAKIRYRQADQEVILTPKTGLVLAHFTEPQRAVASGQILVAYDWDIVIGNWVIL